jgi:hypothetical protein
MAAEALGPVFNGQFLAPTMMKVVKLTGTPQATARYHCLPGLMAY